jgi:hypothetical protein
MIYNKYNVLTTRKKFQESYDKTPFEFMFKSQTEINQNAKENQSNQSKSKSEIY